MKTPEILKIFTKHEFNEYNCPFFKSEDIVNIANELEQAISVTRCCKSDSEQLVCNYCLVQVSTLPDDFGCQSCIDNYK
jgi:hypothetical protein